MAVRLTAMLLLEWLSWAAAVWMAIVLVLRDP